jgi:hypothetical protein
VVADTWQGIIALFDAKTTRKRILTRDHRIYGSGAPHPHAGWDLKGEYVEFTSNKRVNIIEGQTVEQPSQPTFYLQD